MKLLINIMIALCISVGTVFGQAEMGHRQRQEGPVFHFDVVNVISPGDSSKSRVNLFVKIAYDELQFIKYDDEYVAKYEVTAVILDDDGNQEDGKIWEESIHVSKFDQTNARYVYAFTNASFDVTPAEYTIVVGLMDLDTGKAHSQKTKIKLRDYYAEKLAISEISFVNQIQVDSMGIKSIRPEVTDETKGIQGTLFAYFEIYSFFPGELINVKYAIKDHKNKNQLAGEYTRRKTGYRTLDYIPIPVDSLAYGAYEIEIKLSDGEHDAKTRKIFHNQLVGLPGTAKDLDEALSQLRYVATQKEWKKIKKAKGKEKLQVYLEFWGSHDPTPGTPANESMDNYYQRVQYANQSFSTMNRKGWLTDMGMLYIILGPPDDVERNEYPRGSRPYQIWYYYRVNRRFIFVDFVGFGEYRLQSPVSIYEIQRIR